jgi:GNAT superfamily N-acetyltransferase
MPRVGVTRTYLRLSSLAQFRPARSADPALVLRRVPLAVERYRTLYAMVGGEWHWRDRSTWSDERLLTHLSRPGVAVWELARGDAPVGYFELEQHEDGTVEIVYFGLVRSEFGRGTGKHLLTCAVEEAFGMGAASVWLHTCTLDSPAALPNYLARGFEPFREERYETEVP